MSGDEVTLFRTAVPGILPVTRLPFGVWLAEPVTSQFWRAYKLNEYLAKICMNL